MKRWRSGLEDDLASDSESTDDSSSVGVYAAESTSVQLDDIPLVTNDRGLSSSAASGRETSSHLRPPSSISASRSSTPSPRIVPFPPSRDGAPAPAPSKTNSRRRDSQLTIVPLPAHCVVCSIFVSVRFGLALPSSRIISSDERVGRWRIEHQSKTDSRRGVRWCPGRLRWAGVAPLKRDRDERKRRGRKEPMAEGHQAIIE